MRDLDCLYIEVSMRAGTSIPTAGIPDLITLAGRLGCCVQCKGNDVTIIAHPGDDPLDLALSWQEEAASRGVAKIATANRGRQLRLDALATPKVIERGRAGE